MLNEYLEEIKKNNCPQDCEFKLKEGIEIAKIPPPNEILGIIISRDPTLNWLEKHYREEKGNRKKLFESAIPSLLIKRIKEFMDDRFKENAISYLSRLIYQNVYWTHLHKCFTDKSSRRSIKFKNKNANVCAAKWLVRELNIAVNDKTKFIIALGNDVQKWVRRWGEENRDTCNNIEIINLLHTSGQNNIIWKRTAITMIEKLGNEITKLADLCE